jgi:hypothetical protein
MTARSVAYPGGRFELRMSRRLWDEALERLRWYGRPDGINRTGSEGLLLLGGVIAADIAVVTGLYGLNHVPQGDRVVVSADEARWLVRALRSRDEKLLAQIHSHRHEGEHSAGDDLWATSFHPGFVSIVVPRFARTVLAAEECGFFEYRDGHFTRWTLDEVVQRFVIIDDVAERGRALLGIPWEGRWKAFVQRLRSIGRPRR